MKSILKMVVALTLFLSFAGLQARIFPDYLTQEFEGRTKNVLGDEIDKMRMSTMAKQSVCKWLISVIPFSCDEGINVISSHDGVGKPSAKPPPPPPASPGTRP